MHCERGILVDDTLQTYDPRIYAVGECVQHRTATFGLVAPLWEQARVCARTSPSAASRRYVQRATATQLKVTGIDLYSAGDFAGGDGQRRPGAARSARGVYKRLVIEDSRVSGAVLYGDVKDGAWYFDLIQNRTDICAVARPAAVRQPCASRSPPEPESNVSFPSSFPIRPTQS